MITRYRTSLEPEGLVRCLLRYQLAKDKGWQKLGRVTCPVESIISFCVYNYMRHKFKLHVDGEDDASKTVLHIKLNHTVSEYQLGTLKVEKASRSLIPTSSEVGRPSRLV